MCDKFVAEEEPRGRNSPEEQRLRMKRMNDIGPANCGQPARRPPPVGFGHILWVSGRTNRPLLLAWAQMDGSTDRRRGAWHRRNELIETQ